MGKLDVGATALIAVLVVGACSSGGIATDSPESVMNGWLKAVGAGDAKAACSVVGSSNGSVPPEGDSSRVRCEESVAKSIDRLGKERRKRVSRVKVGSLPRYFGGAISEFRPSAVPGTEGLGLPTLTLAEYEGRWAIAVGSIRDLDFGSE